MNISQLADQVRDTPLRDVLAHYGFDVKREGIDAPREDRAA